jgi:hypothetical protein
MVAHAQYKLARSALDRGRSAKTQKAKEPKEPKNNKSMRRKVTTGLPWSDAPALATSTLHKQHRLRTRWRLAEKHLCRLHSRIVTCDCSNVAPGQHRRYAPPAVSFNSSQAIVSASDSFRGPALDYFGRQYSNLGIAEIKVRSFF